MSNASGPERSSNTRRSAQRRPARRASETKKSLSFTTILLLIAAIVVGIIAITQVVSCARSKGAKDNAQTSLTASDTQAQKNDSTSQQKDGKDTSADAQKTKDGEKDKNAGDASSDKTNANGKDAQKNDATKTGEQSGSSGAASGGTDGNGSSGAAGGNGSSGGGSGSGEGGEGGGSGSGSGGSQASGLTAAQQKVIEAAQNTPATPRDYGALWVENVFENAGLGDYSGNSCDLYNWYCSSSDRSELKKGMIVGVGSHDHDTAGIAYGHVGIYIGSDQVMDCADGAVRTMSLGDFTNYYGSTSEVRWGWIGGDALA